MTALWPDILRHLGATIAGLVGGAVVGGTVVAPVVFWINHPGGQWGSEFQGAGEVLVFGLVGAIAGTIALNVMAARLHRGSVRARNAIVATVVFMLGSLPGAALGSHFYSHGGPGTILYPPDAPPECRSPYVTTEKCGKTMPYEKDPSDRKAPLWVSAGAIVVGGGGAMLAGFLGMRLRVVSEDEPAS